jgi:hypothetical protein
MTTYRFPELHHYEERSGWCPVCGKRTVRKRRFTMTENPWNRNEDGTVRTTREIWSALAERAGAWEPDFTHQKCADELEVAT